MSDAQNATEAAIYAALSPDGVLEWPIHQHVPEDTPPPVNIIGDLSGEPLGAKGDPDEEVTVEINTVFQGEARKPVLEEQARIIAALDEQSFTAGGFTIRPLKAGSDAVLLPDGETYLGTARFTVFALKN